MVNICASIYVTIIHADMDAFYASVGQRDNLYLKGGLVVGGGGGRRGVISTWSYEVRALWYSK